MWLETLIVCITVYMLFSEYWQARTIKVELETELIELQISKLSEEQNEGNF